MALNILLVDDSATVRAVITKSLEMAGVPVGALYEAGNGQEGLDILRSVDLDLVFADINMPVMNGIEMVDTMKEEGLLDRVPVIMVSTDGSATRIEELRQKGVLGYLRKPFTPEGIREVVYKVLRGKP